ncbi:26S proteasome non-ATPase regulatory subunit 8 [Zancudomyces culisetae]|uniref:26S proteasome non-ATPase regulatory subunit 8 n=1 Tax=Zancudomyces culisetae TaxID=1213189 RepID=A0A1R1PNE6_ZANCU|nr:26S proteasome non-ATPase regulatory subunit 8 [Zancudomyces culisetae]|eukprot:OMH82461.1 26S proteasome non-ATPase regulatory subunit 8 [Zancudomyces culisetae]
MLVFHRAILELGAEWSVQKGHDQEFEQYMIQLLVFYFDYSNILSPSDKMYYFIGLNLLFLLTQNRISNFNALLERLDFAVIQNNPFISYPIKLEQAIMEGSYRKVWNARNDVPAPEYLFLVDILMNTLKNEVASCANQAYTSLPLEDARSLLFCNSTQEVHELCKKFDWYLSPKDQKIYFNPDKKEDTEEFNPSLVIEQLLTYAQELERIV